MRIEGAHEFPAPLDRVWAALFDAERLQQAIPGCERLDAVGDGEYAATMRVGLAARHGAFEGTVRVLDRDPPRSYRMAVEARGDLGSVLGDTLVTLSETGEGTRLSYSAEVRVGGFMAGVGPRMLRGVSTMIADQFFKRLTRLIR